MYSNIEETAALPDSPNASTPSLADSDGSTISSSSSDTGTTPPPTSPAFYRHIVPSISVSYPEKYSRTFTSRLLGFPHTIVDPSVVTSYCPCTGLSNTLWMPHHPAPINKPKFRQSHGLDTYIDPSCIITSIAGRLSPSTNTLTYGIFHGPGSPHNLSGSVPHGPNERTHTRLHAELYATGKALSQVLELLRGEGNEWPVARNIVLVTDSRRVMHALSSCVYTWKANGWTRARGKKAVANAAAWKTILELVEKVEAHGVGVRIWTVAESVNTDAMMLAAAVGRVGGNKLPPVLEYVMKAMVPAAPMYAQSFQCQQQGYQDTGYGYQAPAYNSGCLPCGRY